MNKARVLIADDHSLLRKGLKQILELEDDIEVIGEAVDGEQVIELVKELKPDIVLMDINMPVINGVDAIRKIKENGSDTKIIVLTIHEGREYLIKTVNEGAVGYIMKNAEAEILIEAIRSVYKGQTYIQPNLATDLIREFDNLSRTDGSKRTSNGLTSRELEVLKLIAEGMNNKEIGDGLYISEKTVKNHVSNIFRKINVNDRTQAAIYAFKNNLQNTTNNM